MKIHHIVARARLGLRPLADPRVCAWLWARLREVFPVTAASVLIPDHVHVASVGTASELKHRLANTLRWVTRKHFGGREIWEAVPEPAPIPNSKHLLRQIRYIHLNPCRDGLAVDPLAWEWSTHRDWTGAAADPWVDVSFWAGEIRWPVRQAAQKIHKYVSGDPTVKVEGTPLVLPRPFDLRERLSSPRLVARALEIAQRLEPGRALRKGVPRVAAAGFLLKHSELSAATIAERLGVTPSAVRRLRSGPGVDPAVERTVIRILSDDRLFNLPESLPDIQNSGALKW